MNKLAVIGALGLAAIAFAGQGEAAPLDEDQGGGGGGGRLSFEEVYALCREICETYFDGRVEPEMLCAIAKIESSFDPSAYRYEAHINDGSHGLVQVLFKTAQWMQERGYRAFDLTEPSDLADARTCLYYGAAYLDTLRDWRQVPREEEWIIRAYNGGMGWKGSATAPYWTKYLNARRSLFGDR
jgi:hypothetical protein